MAEAKDIDLELPLGENGKDNQPAVTAAAEDETVAELKRQIAERDAKQKSLVETAEAERRARLDAEQRLASSHQEVDQYRTQAQTAEQQAVSNAIDAANRESEGAQREYEAAMNNGDYAAASKAQTKIAKAAAQLVQYEAAKVQLDRMAKQPPQQIRVDTSPRDPTEAFLSGFSPRTQGWLRDHRSLIVHDTNGEPNLSPKAMAAHYDALAEGIRAESDEYYAFLENRIAPRQQVEDDDQVQHVQRRAPVAAPVSRDTPTQGGRTAGRIRLTPDQVEIAKISGLTPEQYAANLRDLQAEGKIGRTTH